MCTVFVPLSQAFGQFDAEGDGVVDVESMLIALKNSNGANLKGELSHVIRQLQACSLTPGRRCDLFTGTNNARPYLQLPLSGGGGNPEYLFHRFC